MRAIYSTLILFFIGGSIAYGQLLNGKGEKIRPNYIPFSNTESKVEDVRGEFINFSYRDRIGASELINLTIHNSKGELVRELDLVKQFGQNYFDIKLAEHGISLTEMESYVCRIKNESSEVFERTIRYVSKVKIDITASIVVSPKTLSCEDPTGQNLVEFFANIDGGRAPYKADWYVLNANRTDFLYQPANVIIPSAGLTSSIQVDKSPEYYVLLHVTDDCGNEEIATVQIICDQNEKKVNTLFFEKLEEAIVNKVEILK